MAENDDSLQPQPPATCAQPLLYRCLSCKAEVIPTIPVVPPAQWMWNRRQVPRLLCHHCGCACAPEAWRLVAFEECSRHAAQGMQIDALAHHLWSNCPNSHSCDMEGTYAGDCDQAQSVMPKCLAAVHSRLTRLERQMAGLAKSPPARPRKRPAPAAPTNASLES